MDQQRDFRSHKQAHEDFLTAVANARCRATQEYRYDPYVALGSNVIESRVGHARCILKHDHEGYHEIVIDGKTMVF